MKLNHNLNFENFWQRPKMIWVFAILWLLVISFFAFFWNLGTTGLIDETEPLFAEAARQMTVTGDWITPYFNGDTRFDKPILIYWLMAICYKILGVNTWAVRLPSALSAMGLVCLSFYTLLYFGISTQDKQQKLTPQNWLCALFGATAIALNTLTIIWARIGAADALLAGCLGGALLSFFIGYAEVTKPRVQAGWYCSFYLFIALAILTKGPIGIVLPGLIIGAFLLYLGNLREVLREMQLLRGSLLILIVTLPWYVLVIWRNGWNYINSFFGYHNFERFTGVVNRHSAPWYFYFLVVLIGFIPWSVYLPSAIVNLKFLRRKYWLSSHRSTQLGLFALFWFAGVFSFFTIAVTKLPHYVLPSIPAAAILVAQIWSEKLNKIQKVSVSYKVSGFLNVVLLLVLAEALFYSPNFLGKDPAILGSPSVLIQQSGLPTLGSVIWLITALGIAVLIFQRRWNGLMIANFFGFLTFLILVLIPAGLFVDEVRQLPLRELSAIVVEVKQPGEAFFMVGFKKPSVAFYTQRKVEYISRPTDAVARMKKTTINVPSQPNILVLTNRNKLEKMGFQPNDYQNLGIKGNYQLVRISKSKIQQL